MGSPEPWAAPFRPWWLTLLHTGRNDWEDGAGEDAVKIKALRRLTRHSSGGGFYLTWVLRWLSRLGSGLPLLPSFSQAAPVGSLHRLAGRLFWDRQRLGQKQGDINPNAQITSAGGTHSAIRRQSACFDRVPGTFCLTCTTLKPFWTLGTSPF